MIEQPAEELAIDQKVPFGRMRKSLRRDDPVVPEIRGSVREFDRIDRAAFRREQMI